MKEYYINVNFEDNTIETDLKELVQNDYNSIRLNFEFDIEYDTAMFELKYPNGDTWQKQIVDGSLVIPKGVLYQTEEYEYEISVYTIEGKLTHNKIKNFNVRSELVKDNIPMNDDRVPILSDLINKANKAVENVESFKEEIRNDENLKGEKGDAFTYEDFTPEQLEKLKGNKGDSFKFEDFTEEQLSDLKTSIADSLEFENYDDTEIKDRLSKIEDKLFLRATALTSTDTNNVTTLTITSNKQLQEIEGYTLSEDKKILTKTLTENVGGEVTIISIDGQELVLTYEAAPEVIINISNENDDGTSNKTNQPVSVTLTSNKELQLLEGWELSNDRKTLIKLEYNPKANILVTLKDLLDNSITISYTIRNVDTIAPGINRIVIGNLTSGKRNITMITTEATKFDNDTWSANRVGGFAASYTKKITEEEIISGYKEEIVLEDRYGNVGCEKIIISLVDGVVNATHTISDTLVAKVKASNENEDGTTNKTNQPVTVTITANRELQPLEGWTLSELKNVLTRLESDIQIDLQVTIKDLDNNELTLTYSVTNVDTKPPYIKNSASAIKATKLTSGNIRVTIQADMSKIINSDWTNKSSGLFTKEYTVEELANGVEEYISMKDSFDNVGVEKVTMSYVNEIFTATHEIVEHTEHDFEQAEIYEATENKTHNHIVKQVCEMRKEENVISTENEACAEGELNRQPSDSENCYIQTKICTLCGQETYRYEQKHIEGKPDKVGNIKCIECGTFIRKEEIEEDDELLQKS